MLHPLYRQLCFCISLTIPLGLIVSNPSIAQTIPSISTETTSARNRPSYILGAGDQLDITVFNYEEFTGPKVVLPDGTITLPMIGRIEVVGLTTEQLTQRLTTQLNTFLVDPVVTVGLSVLRPVLVTVAGEVQRPGPIQLRSLTTTNLTIGGNTIEGTPTVSVALIEAGGITQQADIRQISLRRYNPDGNSQPIIINFWDAIGSDNATQDFILQDGDSIYVPRLDPNTTLDRRLIARASFAPDTIRVRVVGEVNNPGEVQVPPDSSLSSAVAIAGGPTDDARLSRVTFVRMNEEGQIERQRIDLRNLTDNYQVQEGDVIIVPKSDTSSLLERAVQVLNPLNILLELLP